MSLMAPSRPAPRWDQLLAIGLDRLVNIRPYLWYLGVGVVAGALDNLMPRGDLASALIAFALVAVDLWAGLVLSRQFMLGELGLEGRDPAAAGRLFGLYLVAALGAVMIFEPVGRAIPQLEIFTQDLGNIAVSLVFARMAFFQPALALGDPTSFRRAFAQADAYWGRLAAITLVTIVPLLLVKWAFRGAELTGLPFGAIEGLLNAATEIVLNAAASYLYWKHVRA